MQEKRAEELLEMLGKAAPEPSAQSSLLLRDTLLAEMARIRAERAERELARFGLVPAYHFAQTWLKEHPLRVLAPAAVGITLLVRISTGATLPHLLQVLAGGW
jgi:hypothetical protein